MSVLASDLNLEVPVSCPRVREIDRTDQVNDQIVPENDLIVLASDRTRQARGPIVLGNGQIGREGRDQGSVRDNVRQDIVPTALIIAKSFVRTAWTDAKTYVSTTAIIPHTCRLTAGVIGRGVPTGVGIGITIRTTGGGGPLGAP